MRLQTAFLLVFAIGLHAQSAPASRDRFEVASIRRSSDQSSRPSVQFTPGGGIRATNVTLKMLIEMAYDLRPEQLSNGPGWTDSEQYVVIAREPENSTVPLEPAQPDLARKRLQTLLAERFHLTLNRNQDLATGYILAAVKNGHKMTPADTATPRLLRQTGRWQLRAEGVEMSTLARFLGVHLRATVIDQTGLDGRYTFQLNWTPDGPDDPARDLPEESLIPAVSEQLGLRLEQQKVVTERYTIEHAEKPADN